MPRTSQGEPPGRASARILVKEIAKEHGHLGEDVLGRLDQVTRREVEEALLKKDLMIGSSVITLAKNLYTSKARFVFELLQNADDNHYSKALADGANPFVAFHVHPRRIVVECNEDGFTRENLVAICNIGQSSKTSSQGYIGEKGIGFKSVFMAAWKAEIQSGDFSFYFQHRKQDSGMGMISPVWQEPEHELDGPLTRITLFLHEFEDPATIATERETVSRQFQELKDTILIFLKNLKKIKITFYDDDENVDFSTSYSMDHLDDVNQVVLKKLTTINGSIQESKKYYHVTKYLANNLAKNENRSYPAEETTRVDTNSEVILAFPLSADSSPIIESQDIFAFLPIRSMGFKFLSQADFVTLANRQDIVTTSKRNRELRDGIARAFIKAVLQFCQHPTLQYQWVRYLPKPADYPWDYFWAELLSEIGRCLEYTRVLRPRGEGALKLIKSLRRNNSCLDRVGNPLFNDIKPQVYLSVGYTNQDLDILLPYGLVNITMNEILDRVSEDLRSQRSKMRSAKTDNDWHSRAAKLLIESFKNVSRQCITRLKELHLLPLQDGQWDSINNGPIYYAKIGEISIPKDLPLKLINPTAAENCHRNALFCALGVKEASSNQVRELICKKYECSVDCDSFDLSISRCHLEYLYLTYNPEAHRSSELSDIEVYCRAGTLEEPYKVDFYLSDNEPYGVGDLLRTNLGGESGPAVPGRKFYFLHSGYLEDIQMTPAGHTVAWKEWLYTQLNIRRYPRLTSDRSKLSHLCYYIAEYRPERFLGMLQYHWQFVSSSIVENPSRISALRKIKVICKNNQMIALKDTYLPLPSLESFCARFMDETRFFPFLKLESPLHDESNLREWEFLHTHFGVGFQNGLIFSLAILKTIMEAETLRNESRVYSLYEIIQARCLEATDRRVEQEKALDFFELNSCILIPARGTEGPTWCSHSDCLWNAPASMGTKFPLESLYRDYFGRSGTDMMTLTQFFKTTLEVPDGEWKDFVEELKFLETSECTDFDRISDLYERIRIGVEDNDDDADNLREAFQENPLIYVFRNGQHRWHKISECIWASATSIRGKTTLNDHYDDLKGFFVNILGVTELTFAMVIDELVEKGSGDASVKDIKNTLWALNSLLPSQRPPPSARRILESRIFPVKYPNGSVKLRTSQTDFAINDRQHLGDVFANRARFLDFSLDEVRRLRPFLHWVGFGNRYVSSAVKEISLLEGGDPLPISNQDRSVSRRARGLFRIAVHYNSPRTPENDQSLFNLLQSAQVYETEGILSQLSLSQDGHNITTEGSISQLHIHEEDSSLEIYVPRDARSQEFCYCCKLPRRLLEWIMTEPTTQIRETVDQAAETAITKVLATSSSAVDWILEAEGIIPVNFIDNDEDEPNGANLPTGLIRLATPAESARQLPSASIPSEHGTNSETLVQPSPSLSLGVNADTREYYSAINEVAYTNLQSRYATSSSFSQPIYTPDASRSHATPVPRLSQSIPNLGPDAAAINWDARYEALLNKVILAARRSVFPSHGSFNMSTMINALPDVESSESEPSNHLYERFRSVSQIERDRKIGAAGELFVFEVLSHLLPRLPNFERGNWQSTIRKYVTIHTEYADMESWNQPETADIRYDDRHSVLTDLFIDKGYIAEDRWRGLRPDYYIEVKSTTGPCETPFYMSKYQFRRMQALSNGGEINQETNRPSIYVIFRVFNLDKDNVGLRIYIDPEVMRRTERLLFHGEKWSVVPARGAENSDTS